MLPRDIAAVLYIERRCRSYTILSERDSVEEMSEEWHVVNVPESRVIK